MSAGKDQRFTLHATVTYEQVSVLGPPDSYAEKITIKTRTSTKQVKTTLTEFGAKLSAGYSTESKASVGLPIEGLKCSCDVTTKFNAGFETTFKHSNTQTDTTETESSYESIETTTYNGEPDKQKYIFLEKFNIGTALYKSRVVIKYDAEGEATKDKVFRVKIEGILKAASFKLKNGNGHFLAVPSNDLKNYKPCVWTELGETGQSWVWEGSHIRNMLGTKYLAVREDSGSKGAGVILWDKTSELGQQWTQEGSYIRSGKGHYLAVNGNGGKGTELCVWSKTAEGGQKWEFV